MRKLILPMVMVAAIGMAGLAQIRIPETPVSFKFPNGGWKYLNTISIDKNKVAYLYSYCGKYVTDQQGDTILPHLRIYVERNYTGSLYMLAYLRYTNEPYQSLSESTGDMEGVENYSIVGAYTNFDDRKDYQFRMMYFKVKNTVYEFRIETTRDTYEQFEDEFNEIIKSISVSGK